MMIKNIILKLSKFDHVIVLIASFFFSVASLPLKVTVDGYFYLSNATVLFTNDFKDSYYWIREPGYSVFLKIINIILGDSDRMVIGLQGSLMIYSFYLLGKLLVRDFKSKKAKLLFIISTFLFYLNPLNIFYAGMILQQSIFTIFVNIIVYCCIKNKPSFGSGTKNKIILIIAVTFACLTSIILVFYLLSVLFLFYLVDKSALDERVLNLQHLIKYSMLLALSGLILFLWNNYKENTTLRSGKEYSLELLSKTPFSDGIGINNLSGEVSELIFRVKGLTHLGPTNLDSGAHESDIFVGWMLNKDYRCGAFDSFEMLPYTENAKNFIRKSCPSYYMHDLQNTIYSKLSTYQLELFWYFYFFVTFPSSVFLFFRNKRAIDKNQGLTFSVLIWILIYAFGTNGNYDRYAMPIYGLMVLSNVFVFFSIFRYSKNFIKKVFIS